MDRKDFYYRQKVLENDLDEAFDGAENSINNVVKDMELGRDETTPTVPSEFGGIYAGLDASIVSGLDVAITQGAAFDTSGRRVATNAGYNVTTSNIGDITEGGGGAASGSSTAVASGNSRWATIFIVFDRLLSDTRFDGYNQSVQYERKESFHFYVAMGPEKLDASLLDTDKPDAEAGKQIVTDVKLKNTGSGTFADSVSEARKEIFFRVTAAGGVKKALSSKTLRPVIKSFLQFYNDHVSGTGDLHNGQAVTFLSTEQWADTSFGGYGPSTAVSEAINAIVSDLAAAVGANRVGMSANAGSANTTHTQASPVDIAATHIYDALLALQDAINGRVFRGGDDGIGAAGIHPAANDTSLGKSGQAWNAYLSELYIDGDVTSSLIPDALTWTLGTHTKRWTAGYIDFLDMTRTDGASNEYFDLVATGNANNGTMRFQIAGDESNGGVIVNPRNGHASALTAGDYAYWVLGWSTDDKVGMFIQKAVVNAVDPDEFRIGLGLVTNPGTNEAVDYYGGGPTAKQNDRKFSLNETGARFMYGTEKQGHIVVPLANSYYIDMNSAPQAVPARKVDAASPFERYWQLTPHSSGEYRIFLQWSVIPQGARINEVSVLWESAWVVAPTTQAQMFVERRTLTSGPDQTIRAGYHPVAGVAFSGTNGQKLLQTQLVTNPADVGNFANWDQNVDTLEINIRNHFSTNGTHDKIYMVRIGYVYDSADPFAHTP